MHCRKVSVVVDEIERTTAGKFTIAFLTRQLPSQ